MENKSPNLLLGIIIVLVILLLTALGPYYNIQSTVLYFLLPLLTVVALVSDYKSFNRGNSEITIYIIIIILTLTTIFYKGYSHEQFMTSLYGMLGALMGSYIAVGINKTINYDDYFHIGFIVGAIALILIEYSLGNFTLFKFASIKGSRGRFYFNANYYSYISYFANFSLFYLHLKYRKVLTLIPLLIFPLVSLILSFITQSRSGLLFIILINSVFWLFILRSQKKNIINKIARSIVLITAAVFLIIQLISIYQSSLIKTRIANSDEDSRIELAKEGFVVFMEYPFTGVGLGQFPRYSQYNKFSHNSYSEILAEHGLIGGILLLILFGMPFIKSIQNLKRDTKNSYFRLNFLFFVTFLLYNNAYVFYKFSFSMMYFFLIISLQFKELNSVRNKYKDHVL